jgi:hypothetical protein
MGFTEEGRKGRNEKGKKVKEGGRGEEREREREGGRGKGREREREGEVEGGGPWHPSELLSRGWQFSS